MNLIPFPKSILHKKGHCDLNAACVRTAAGTSAHDSKVRGSIGKIEKKLEGKGLKVVSSADDIKPAITLSYSSDCSSSEDYRLGIIREGVSIKAEGPAGIFYGTRTLLQLIEENGTRLPCLEIEDSPDYPVRGFLHDVTRGKVPTLDTLKLLVDKLAYYKINQLQLYIEHAFAFSHLPELWQHADPLTPEEIRELDVYCRDNCVELVPCLATFGHLYELLRLKRFEHLNELEIKASELPHSLWDRMAHYTIDPSREESYLLVKSMLDEFLPLFRSRYCNICCDETFDLGGGRNRKRAEESGVDLLYGDFVQKLMGVVRSHGKTPMLWGDRVLHSPWLIAALPPDALFLNWAYGADVTEEGEKTFAAAGAKHYVCPGVQGWSRFAYDINTASENIRKLARFGRENGATGMLTTDWGDCGHVNFIAGSYHGMALGAALSWNVLSYPEDWQFDCAVSSVEWSDSAGTIVRLLRELGSLCFYHFGNMYAWVNGIAGTWDKEREVQDADCSILEKRHLRASAITGSFLALKSSGNYYGDLRDIEEFIWSGNAVRWTLGLLCYKKRNEYNQLYCNKIYGCKNNLIEDGTALLRTFELLWRMRNKESELKNVTGTFKKMFARIESMTDD